LLKGYRKVWPVLRALETWSDTGVIDSINHGPGRITLAHTLGGSFIGSDRIVTFKNSIILDRWWAWVTSTLHPTASSVSQVVDQFDRSVTLTPLARVFMLSESGRMGWIPENAIRGDVIAVLTGGRVPFVLRPVENGYRLLGGAYVQGIMDGEVMTDDTELDYITLI
jgi:hypothetical protein